MKTKILVIGDLMIDRNYWGSSHRVSPEAPVPIISVQNVSDSLGGAGNVCANLSAAGLHVQIISAFGGLEKNCVKSLLDSYEIDYSKCIKIHKTTTKCRIWAGGHQTARFDFDCNTSDIPSRSLIDALESLSFIPPVVVLSDYNKGIFAQVRKIINFFSNHDVKILVDPKSKNIANYSGAYIVKPNRSEFMKFTHFDSSDSLENNAKRLCSKFGIENLIITSDSQEVLWSTSSSYHSFQVAQVPVSDVTGAGDTFIAYLGASLTRGQSIPSSIEKAIAAATIAVKHHGTKVIFPHDFELYDDTPIFIPSSQPLPTMNRDGGLVFTNGCFDLLHAGHLNLLRHCRALGKYVIVGLNSDASVSLIKGDNRPINKINDRATTLLATNLVDYVIEFEESTPIKLIHNLKPDYIVKGGDYHVRDVVGAKFIKEYGGEVVILETTKGFSTSKIIENMIDKI